MRQRPLPSDEQGITLTCGPAPNTVLPSHPSLQKPALFPNKKKTSPDANSDLDNTANSFMK